MSKDKVIQRMESRLEKVASGRLGKYFSFTSKLRIFYQILYCNYGYDWIYVCSGFTELYQCRNYE